MMRILQELVISGPSDRLAVLPDEIEKRLDNGWSRNRTRNIERRRNALVELFCFHCEPAPRRKAADLWLLLSEGQLRVSNIVPSSVNSMSYGEYNRILTEFAE